MTMTPSIPRGLTREPWDDQLVRIGPDRLREGAARLVAAGETPDFLAGDRFLAYAAENEVPLEVMWGAVDARGDIAATALGVPNRGRTAMVFATRATSSRRAPAISRAIQRVCDELASRGVRLAQSLLEPRERAERGAFESAGFTVLAMLAYLQRSLTARRANWKVDWPSGVAIEPFRAEVRRDFLAALEASYEGTLDCPGLTGLRDPDDVLSGHQGTGSFDPTLWTLLRKGGEPAGVLLMNPTPRQDSVELVYLGLAPGARGRGLGRQLLRHGLLQVAPRPERAVTLAVDERNEPAVGLYSRHGFRRLLRRCALIRPLDGSAL